MRRRHQGFTLVELLVVIAIIRDLWPCSCRPFSRREAPAARRECRTISSSSELPSKTITTRTSTFRTAAMVGMMRGLRPGAESGSPGPQRRARDGYSRTALKEQELVRRGNGGSTRMSVNGKPSARCFDVLLSLAPPSAVADCGLLVQSSRHLTRTA